MEVRLWIAYLLGVVTSIVLIKLISFIKTGYGTLKIDNSNPEKDIYRIELDELEDLSTKKKIVLKIDNNADLSQE